jgi:hypothetical protein
MRESINRVVAAQHLREILCSSFFGDLLHQLSDADSLDLALKLSQRIGTLVRAEIDADAPKTK